MNLIRKLFNIRKGEGAPVAVIFLFFFFVVAVSIAGKTARDTIFLDQYDKTYLPLMFVAIAVVVSIVIPIYTALTRNSGRLITILVVNLLSAGTILVFYFSMHDIMIPVFYVLMEVVVILTGLQLWGLAGTIFNPMQAKRVFPLLSAGGSLAAIMVGFGIRPFVARFESETLLLVTIVFLFLAVLISYFSKPYFIEQTDSGIAQQKQQKVKHGFNSYLTFIAVMVGLSALVSTLVDYQFKMTASSQFQSSELAGFFGMYYAATGVAGLIIQLFIVSRLLARLGVLVGLLILPLFLLLGSSSFLILPGLLSISAAKFSDQTFKFTIHNTASQLLWLPVPGPQKAKIKPVVSGTIKTTLEGLAGITTFFAIRYMSVQQLSFIAIALIVGWIVITFFLKGGYIRTLETAIEKRQLDFTELKIDSTDKAMVKTLGGALVSGDIYQQHFALELMEGMTLTPWKESLLKLMAEASLDIRTKIVDLSKDDTNIVSDEWILSSIESTDDLVIPAIRVAAYRKLETAVPHLKTLLDHEKLSFRTAAAHGLLKISEQEHPPAGKLLESLIESGNEEEQVAALKAVRDLKGFLKPGKINTLLNNDSYKIRLAALDLCIDERDEALIPGILNNIRSSKTAGRAREVLNSYSEERVLTQISSWLEGSTLEVQEKINLATTLKNFPAPETIEILMEMWNTHELSLCGSIADSLLSIARMKPIPPETIQKIDRLARQLARGMYEDTKTLLNITGEDHGKLLTDYINRRLDQTLPIILKLGVLDMPDTRVETYIQYIRTKDQKQMPFLYELLDTIFSKDERQALLPLITPMSNMERVRIGHRLFPELSKIKIDQQLEALLKSSNPWEASIAAFYILQEADKEKLIPPVFEACKDNELLLETIQFLVNKRLNDYKDVSIPETFKIKELPAMYSTLEKTLILKSVPLFRSIPGKDLARVAQIAEEVHCAGEESIFKEGDPGHSMFIIVDGEILIHRDVKKIAVLKKGEALGEMALLDQEPRSADATTGNDAILLEINQEGFYELMSGNLEIMRGIIKLLTGRLRTAIA